MSCWRRRPRYRRRGSPTSTTEAGCRPTARWSVPARCRGRFATRSRNLPSVTVPVRRALPVAAVMVAAGAGMPAAHADNRRLNDGVIANVYTIQHQASCTNDVKKTPQLQLAAEWHANDVLNNRALDGDIGSDGSTVQDRANAAGYRGTVAETVAINPALAISGVEIINNWYY